MIEPAVAVAADAGRLTVNKRELAKLLKCSLPTLNELIDRYPDFPVVKRGSNGVEWEFDAQEVIDFLRMKEEAENRAAAERASLFKQFSLPIDAAAPEGAGDLSPSARRSLAEARLKERRLAIETGMLAEVPALRQNQTLVIGRLGRFFDNLPQQLAREFNLPEEVMRSMRKRLDDQRRGFVAEIDDLMGQTP